MFSQDFFRYEAEYSIKEKSSQDSPLLNIGTVYFDKNIRQIVYDVTFPEREIVIMNDTSTIRIRDNEVIEVIQTINFLDFTMYNLILNGDLSYFGLKNTSYQLANIEKENGMVISTWEPPTDLQETKGKMLLSQVDKKLNGLITFDHEENIISKQFFKDYVQIEGINIPTTVTQFLYIGMDEKIKWTTYKNLKINNLGNEEFYNYTIPVY